MTKKITLDPTLQKQLRSIGKADLVLGIPSFNNVATIAHVVRAAQAGLSKYFPGMRAVLVNSDGGSTDGTQASVREASMGESRAIIATHPLFPVHRIVTPYHGIPGKGSALRTIFQAAHELEATACAVVDADLRSITPAWMDFLLGPVVHEQFDFVAPLYLRHKYDGTITNSIVYPMTRSLYGLRVRQPIGGDFGLSRKLVSYYLEQDVWDTDVARFGIDIWMSTTAIAERFKVCQSFMGAKIHDAKDPGLQLAQMLQQVMSAFFDLTVAREATWKPILGSVPVPLFGMEHAVGLEPVKVDHGRMLRAFRSGVRDLGSIWSQILRPEAMKGLLAMGSEPESGFHMPVDLWVRILHDFALAYRARAIGREHLLQSLTPIYLGRVASFIGEAQEADAAEAEALLEDLCMAFERLKPEFVDLWERPGRRT